MRLASSSETVRYEYQGDFHCSPGKEAVKLDLVSGQVQGLVLGEEFGIRVACEERYC